MKKSAEWPRVYARHRGTGDTFELIRGVAATNEQSRGIEARESGPAWHVWVEHRLRDATRIDAHFPPHHPQPTALSSPEASP